MLKEIRDKLPHWLSQFEHAVLLDSNFISSAGGNDTYEFIAGWAGKEAKAFSNAEALNGKGKWKLGYICFESLHKQYGIEDRINSETGFEGRFFFEPEVLIYMLKGSNDIIVEGAGENVLDAIRESVIPGQKRRGSINLVQSVSREQYLDAVQRIKEHIVEGDFYEMNFCIDFHAHGVQIDPASVFKNLTTISPTPFASFVKHADKILLCASPERFLKREGEKIIAQPIKGTERRSADEEEDKLLKLHLQNSEKERAENVMIVDLMRNDLAQCSKTGSVHVEELFGVYSFSTVHQLISTVSAQLRPGITFGDILEKTFPMGSMTGAPKRAVIHAINRYEPVTRNIFSGSVGYITPEGDFDLNVVIRSIIYNSRTGYLSFYIGSAITFDSDPEHEYRECLLKAQTMFKALDIISEMP
jgi:para-aminobenzoate synthetase component 1